MPKNIKYRPDNTLGAYTQMSLTLTLMRFGHRVKIIKSIIWSSAFKYPKSPKLNFPKSF